MFAKKKDFLLIGVILLLAAALWLGLSKIQQPAQQAEIRYDGILVQTVSLTIDREFSLSEDPTVHFQVKDGAIAFVHASCPDKICEHTGFLSKQGQTAACLPKKVLLTVTQGGDSLVDAVAS